MDCDDRPNLGLKFDLAIESTQNLLDGLYWQQLKAMQVPSDGDMEMLRKAYPNRQYPPISKTPVALLQPNYSNARRNVIRLTPA